MGVHFARIERLRRLSHRGKVLPQGSRRFCRHWEVPTNMPTSNRGPPLWFFFEHFYYFPWYGNPALGKEAFSALSAAQSVTAKLWAAMAVVLGAMYTSAEKSPASSKCDDVAEVGSARKS